MGCINKPIPNGNVDKKYFLLKKHAKNNKLKAKLMSLGTKLISNVDDAVPYTQKPEINSSIEKVLNFLSSVK